MNPLTVAAKASITHVRVRVRGRVRCRVMYKCERSDRLNPFHM